MLGLLPSAKQRAQSFVKDRLGSKADNREHLLWVESGLGEEGVSDDGGWIVVGRTPRWGG